MLTWLIGKPVIGVLLAGIGKAVCFVGQLPVEATQNVQEALKIGAEALGIPCV